MERNQGVVVGSNLGKKWRVDFQAGYSTVREPNQIQLASTAAGQGLVTNAILGGTICMGDWKAIDDNHVRRSHVGWTYVNGNPSGYFTETETDEVSRDGRSYHGTNDAKIYDLEGNMLAEAAGTAVATRISPP